MVITLNQAGRELKTAVFSVLSTFKLFQCIYYIQTMIIYAPIIIGMVKEEYVAQPLAEQIVLLHYYNLMEKFQWIYYRP